MNIWEVVEKFVEILCPAERDVVGDSAPVVFCALEGHKVVAGGNAPGKRDLRSPTLKGSHFPVTRDTEAVEAFRI
jgi:hypothetical protein